MCYGNQDIHDSSGDEWELFTPQNSDDDMVSEDGLDMRSDEVLETDCKSFTPTSTPQTSERFVLCYSSLLSYII